MFQIEEIDPTVYREKTRKATFIVMGIFLVIGFAMATSFVDWFGEYSNNHIVLNFLGAFVGLLMTFMIVKWFFVDKPWMKEAMYSWRLKRSLMYITNVHKRVQEAAANDDENAMKVMRFYHLGLTQMHQLENNHHALIDMKTEKDELVEKMTKKGMELNQDSFDPQWVEEYKPQH